MWVRILTLLYIKKNFGGVRETWFRMFMSDFNLIYLRWEIHLFLYNIDKCSL